MEPGPAGTRWHEHSPVLAVMVWLFFLAAPHAHGALSVPSAERWLPVEPATTYQCLPLTEQDLDGVLAGTFEPLPDQQIAFGYQQSSRCWFRFELVNDSDAVQRLILDVDYGLLDRIVLYRQTNGTWVQSKSGDAVPWGERAAALRKHAFPLALAAGERADFLMSVETINSFYAPLKLWQEQAFYEHFLFWDWLIGGFYGIALGMLVYNLFLWLSFRERVFLWYLVYVSSTLLVLASWHGVSLRVWPDSAAFNNLLLQNMIYLGGLSTIQFARQFLDTRQRPRLDRVLSAYVWLVVCMLALQLVLPAAWLAVPVGAVTILGCVLALAAGVISWLSGMRFSQIYVLAWSAFLGVAVFISLGAYGLVSRLPAAIELMQFSVVAQQVMLSIGLAMRITELRRQRDERQLAAATAQAESAAKTEFLAKMSHEIRTPMNAVLGITELMNDTNLSEQDQRRYVETLHTAGQTLMYVINDILDFSKMSAGKLELVGDNFDLHALVRECVSIMAVGAHEKSLHISALIRDDQPRWFVGDQIRIRQILLNLLGNAVKFTESGAIEVHLSVGPPGPTGGRRITLAVKDSGMGISAEEIQKLFQPFEQVDGTSTRRFGGTGLGLAICRQLAELMGGDICVDSKPGEGSTFTVTLLLQEGEETEQRVPDRQGDVAGLSVLVVEDNPVNQMVIRAMLQRLGLMPSIAHNGREGLDFIKLNHGQLDLVFMDCEMPEMDGYQATRLLRQWERDHGMNRLTVVAMTAHAFAEHRERCYQAGMDEHITKPLSGDEVMLFLEKVARRKKEKLPHRPAN